jgi:hypothetical protein
MKSNEHKQKFINLRAKGLSFDKISREIKISKPTLLKWNEEFSKEINNATYLEMESFIVQHGLAKKARIESMAVLLEKAIEEFKARSFEDLSAKELLAVVAQMDTRISKEFSDIRYVTEETITLDEDLFKEISRPKTLPFVF